LDTGVYEIGGPPKHENADPEHEYPEHEYANPEQL
jgi:hypothetical protein